MTKNTKIILIVVILVVVVGLFIFVRQSVPSGFFSGCCGFGITSTSTPSDTSNSNNIIISPELPDIDLPLSSLPKDVAWKVFEKYLSYNKAHDLNGIKRIVYQVATVCSEGATFDCVARMDQAYFYGSKFNKSDFINVWSDERQIILSTDFWQTEDKGALGRYRSIIYFINVDGDWKLLSFSPAKGGAVSKGSASMEELQDRILRYTEDTDKDGVADYSEECLAANEMEECTPTNPNLRDSDSDGLWDGIEALM